MKPTAVLALATLVALAACSSGSSSSSTTTDAAASSAPAAAATTATVTGGATDACALVTQAEAAAAMGSAAQAGITHTDRDGYGSCRYYDAKKTKNVFVQFVDPKLADAMAAMGAKDVAGVGDRAMWLSGSIFVQKAGKAAQVGLYLSAASMKTMDPGETDLAKIAAGRM